MKSVLITGCSNGGIGSALAKAFQTHDLQVFATARDVSKMADLVKLSNVTLLALDVTDSSQISAAVDTVKSHTGGTLDYLVNNSGKQHLAEHSLYDENLEFISLKRLFSS